MITRPLQGRNQEPKDTAFMLLASHCWVAVIAEEMGFPASQTRALVHFHGMLLASGLDFGGTRTDLTSKFPSALSLQHWTDEFLQWDPACFDNITQISLPAESIWVPDILINEL